MANVAVTVNGRTYDLTCNDGQEPHLRALATEIGGRVEDLVKTIGQAGEARLLLMVGLLLADELADANAEIDRLQQEQGRARRPCLWAAGGGVLDRILGQRAVIAREGFR